MDEKLGSRSWLLVERSVVCREEEGWYECGEVDKCEARLAYDVALAHKAVSGWRGDRRE